MFDDLHDPNPPIGDAHRLAAVAERAARRRRRHTAVLTGATTVVLVASGVTALAMRSPGGSPVGTPTTPTPAAAPPTTGTPPPPTSTTPVTAPVPGTSPPVTAPAPSPGPLAELAVTIAERAGTVSSFAGRVEQEFACCGSGVIEPPVREVVFRADGSMWTTDEYGGWASYDPTTGVSRVATRAAPDAEFAYQEISGWNDNSVGENVLLGFSPVLDLTTLAGDVTVVEAPYPAIPGRPAWRLDVAPWGDDGRPTDTASTTYWIDQATGITLAFESTETDDAAHDRTVRSSRLTTFTVDVALPPAFPGEFPAGATVDRTGDPDAFTGDLTDAELAEAFGDGLLLPDAPGTTRQVELGWTAYDDEGRAIREPGTAADVRVTLARGFDRTTIRISRDPVPPVGADPVTHVPDGPLAGLPVHLDDWGGYVAVVGDGADDAEHVLVTVRAVSADRAAALLATLRPASG